MDDAAQTRQVVLITGAAGGIGKALAKQLAQRGARVAALDRDADALRALAAGLGTHGRHAWRAADVTDADDLRERVAELAAELGPIDLAIACAGTAQETPAAALDPRQVDKVIRLNLVGVANTIAAVLPGMLERGRGQIAAISSLASFRGLPCQMAYCASKAGVNAMMESLRLDVKDHGIDVTTVCPGWTRTAQTKGQFDDDDLMAADTTAAEILWAIDRRLRWHAFPRALVWQLRLLSLLPTWLRDRLLLRRIRQLKQGRGCEKAARPHKVS